MIWVFIILVVLTFAFNKLTIKYGLKGVSYKRNISKEVVEIGEEFEVITIIENRKIFPIAFLQITEKFPLGLKYKIEPTNKKAGDFFNYTNTLFIMPYQRVRRIYPISGLERGRYVFEDSNLRAGDFIGFKTSNKKVENLQVLVVLPKKLNLNENLVPFGNYQGDISVRRWIIDDPLMTIGIREYTGNDPERYIHWASSLRYGKLMVKNFDFTTDTEVKIILNIESSKPFWVGVEEEKVETCISLCRGVVEELEQSGIPYSFISNSYGGYDRLENSNTLYSNNYNEILMYLGKMAYGVRIQFEELIDSIVNRRTDFTTFVVITPKVFDSYIKPLAKLTQKGNKVILISLDENNLKKLDTSIIKYVRRIS